MDLSYIRYIFFDVDGTLTDGTINIGNNGEMFKSFYCKDGLGIQMLQEAGLKVVILTSRESDIVLERGKELNIDFILQGAKNKKRDQLKHFMEQYSIAEKEIAYMGDDINDLECMRICSLVACPSDADERVKSLSNFISKYEGGRGAVREFAEWFLGNYKLERDSGI